MAAPQNLGDEVCQRLLAEPNGYDDQSDLASEPEDLQQQHYQQQPAFYGTFVAPPSHPIAGQAHLAANQIHTRDSSSSSEPVKTLTRPKRYRLVLLITLGFDVGLVIFLSIISFVNTGQTGIEVYFQLDLYDSLFDLVVLSLLRFVLNSLFYLILGWVTRIVITITVVGSTFYVPVKGYFYWSHMVNNVEKSPEIQSIIVLLLLFASFVVPWFEAFFFEFKYLPSELSRLQSVKWWNWRLWLCPWMIAKRYPPPSPPPQTIQTNPSQQRPYTTGNRHFTNLHRHSSLDTVFRTPMGGSPLLSPRYGSPNHIIPPIREESCSSSEPPPPECDQLSPADELYVQKGIEAMNVLEALTSTDNGWVLEKYQDGITVYSQARSPRKIWKSEMVLDYSADRLWQVIYNDIGRMSEWNANLSSIEQLHRVDHYTDIMYSVAAAVGPISQRDFVCVRRGEKRNGIYYSASMSVVYDDKPPMSGRVRGENGPSGQVVVALGQDQCKFIWVFDIDPKIWIMQAIIDQTYSGILRNASRNLRDYLMRNV